MYTPSAFELPGGRDGAFRFLDQSGLATLVTAGSAGLDAVHLPLVLDRASAPEVLLGHVARANPIWQTLEHSQVLAIVRGPDAYVSPDWYETSGLVPTWNYVALHIYGRIRLVEDQRRVRAILDLLSARHEERLRPKMPWTMAKLTDDRVRAMLKGIVAFAMSIDRVVGKQKTSQNRTVADQHAVAAELARQPNEGAQRIARFMRDQKP
jgi:transcriptional regulator